jgi:hypothetical protein
VSHGETHTYKPSTSRGRGSSSSKESYKPSTPSGRGAEFGSSGSGERAGKPSPDRSTTAAADEPKPEYATARDEVKAIYYAKTGTYSGYHLLDRIEAILSGKGQTWDTFLEVLKPHLGGSWNIPGAFLTHMARIGFSGEGTSPQLKPKPKCPTCLSDNQRGAIFQGGAIAPCPDCSTPEWLEEFAAKEARAKEARTRSTQQKTSTGAAG